MTLKKAVTHTTSILAAALLLGGLVGCDNPDTEVALEEFTDNSQSERDRAADAGGIGDVSGTQVDFSGNYFMTIKTALGGLTLKADVTTNLDANTLDINLQALTPENKENSRQAVGDVFTYTEVPFSMDGTFILDMGTILITGEANGISGSDIIIENLKLNAIVASSTQFCGSSEGQITMPVTLDLGATPGTTFGANAYTDDINTAEALNTCPSGVDVSNDTSDAGMDDVGMDDAEMDATEEGVVVPDRCPEDLEGNYTLTFITSLSGGEPSTITVSLEEAEFDAASGTGPCYTGSVISPTTGDVIGSVVSAVDSRSNLIVSIEGFIIPPGASAALPDGGSADLSLTASQWTADGMCGDVAFEIVEPFALPGSGTFSAVRVGVDYLTSAGPTCADVTRSEPCGFESLAGRHTFFYITSTQISQGAPAAELKLNLEASPITCLHGTVESLLNPGEIITSVHYADASPDNDALPRIFIRNYVIQPGSNPVLPNGGASDIVLTSTQAIGTESPTSFCGDMDFVLFTPFALANTGSFTFGIEGSDTEPTGPDCP